LSVGVAAEIKSKLDIVEFIGESVPLKKAGQSFKGLCPFHGEKTPSFIVTPARESWHCFGCGKGGDIFSFVMERDSVDFPEALRLLAGRAGVELSERTSREDARRKRLREVLDAAIAFYHQVLTVSKAGQPALDYMRGRGFTDETLSTFQIGYAPEGWDSTSKRLIEKRGFREDELEAVGLAIRSQRRRGVYDRFRGRIIFPIRDASGGATGLGGRILDRPAERAGGDETRGGGESAGPGKSGAQIDRGPKYLNTPTTLLFDKSRTLYLIDRAKGAIRKEGRAVLVEGNTDALMAHQAGFTNVVGSLGTALTAGQVELITRYAPQVALAYDVDSAGQSAATFGATELSALVGEIERSPYKGRLTDVAVVKLPDGKDPDEVIRDQPETWRKATGNPQPIVEYLIDRHAARVDTRTVQGRERLVNAIMPTIRRVTDPTQRDGYLQILARRSGVEERVLLESLRRPVAISPGRTPRGVIGGEQHAGARINLDAVLSSPGALDPQAAARALEPVEPPPTAPRSPRAAVAGAGTSNAREPGDHSCTRAVAPDPGGPGRRLERPLPAGPISGLARSDPGRPGPDALRPLGPLTGRLGRPGAGDRPVPAAPGPATDGRAVRLQARRARRGGGGRRPRGAGQPDRRDPVARRGARRSRPPHSRSLPAPPSTGRCRGRNTCRATNR
jgi:DNA primase